MKTISNEEKLALALKNREITFSYSGLRPEILLRDVLQKDPKLVASYSRYQVSKGKGLLSARSYLIQFSYDPELPSYDQIVLDDGKWLLSEALRRESPRQLYVVSTNKPDELLKRLQADMAAIESVCPAFRQWDPTQFTIKLSVYSIVHIRCTYAIAPQQMDAMDQATKHALDRVVNQMFAAGKPFISSMPDAVKAYFPYSYLQLNVKFVDQPEDPQDSSYNAEADTLFGVICHKHGSAVGLAHAYMTLAKSLHLECRLIQGRAGTGDDWPQHTWCLVSIGGTFHHVDPSFGINEECVCTDGFLKSDREMKPTHQWDPKTTPECPLRSPSFFEVSQFVQNHYDELLSTGASEDLFNPDMADGY